MIEETKNTEQESSEVSELSLLKNRARLMGLEFSNNIGLETLKERIAEKMSSGELDKKEEPEPLVTGSKPKTLRQKVLDENLKLIRLKITNLDPKKKDLPGEIFTVANEYLGTVKKFIPYGEATSEGYHVPNCIYKMLKERKFLNIRTRVDRVNKNQIHIEHSWAQEFALEVLPQLTPEELKKLATAQLAAGGLN